MAVDFKKEICLQDGDAPNVKTLKPTARYYTGVLQSTLLGTLWKEMPEYS